MQAAWHMFFEALGALACCVLLPVLFVLTLVAMGVVG